MSETLQDLELLRRYAAGRDPDAFAALSRRYAAMVFAAARRVTGSAHDAEDVAQACFLELARRADEVRSSVAGWLHALAVNRARNLVRDQSVRTRYERAVEFQQPRLSDQEPAWDEISPLIDSAIEELPDELRVPLVLHYLHDRDQMQIADELGVSQPTVSRRIRAGVEQLRHILQSRGVTPSIAGLSLVLPMASARGEIVPTTLRASLGKMAVAGIGKPAVVISRAWPIKWIALATAVILGGVSIWLIVGSLSRSPGVKQTINRTAVFRSEGSRGWIDKVPPLVWGTGNSGQRTLLGALSTATAVTDRPIDYNTLIGDSSLAFRVRWRDIRSAADDPYQLAHAVDAQAIAALSQAIGFELHIRSLPEAQQASPDIAAAMIADSIDAGLPVVARDRLNREFGVVYGYDETNGRFESHFYSYPFADAVGERLDLGGTIILFGKPAARAQRKDIVTAALRRAVAWWRHPADGEMTLGDAAFAAWIAAYDCDDRPLEIQHRIWRQSWWNYDMLCDGHHHAAVYLRRHAELFAPAARDALLSAADQFESLERRGLVDSVYKKSDGPWSRKTFEDWSRSRPAGAVLIRQVHEITSSAMNSIENALARDTSP